jgi:methylmalonyl-CoA/ethylmalonyl-CoA epimerase
MIPLSGIHLRLHHVGFVVESIEASMPGFLRSLGATWNSEVFVDPIQKVKVVFLATRQEDTRIELVEPNADDAPVLKFLKQNGGGLHHLCYEVEDLERALQAMRSRGAFLAKRPQPAVAFGGRRIAWVLTAEKLLVEMLEVET